MGHNHKIYVDENGRMSGSYEHTDAAGRLVGGHEYFTEHGITYCRRFNADRATLSLAACSADQSLCGTVTLRSDLTHVEDSAFFQCRQITRVVLPEGLESVFENAFQDCTALEEVVLPGTAGMDYGVFAGCSALRRLRYIGSLDAAVITVSLTSATERYEQLRALTLCGPAGSAAEQAARTLGCAFEAV